ncbi:MAG: DNA-3-methyladenine glycosylase I [Phycisphaeraceae bacterium]|nr:DNA-3-methyladenine glycosylase I [Phycisphaeraceae bacterium]
MTEPKRCAWTGTDRRMIAYHDREWGVPVHTDRKLFEFLILEGAQAGLSWSTILKKRAHYRKVFDRFDPVKIARYTPARLRRLLKDPGIVRNRLKVEATVANARAYLAMDGGRGAFTAYLWSFVGGRTRQNRFATLKQIPAQTPESVAMSKDLRKRGFRFVGPTICYAFMQATGMVNDHETGCFRHKQLRT